MTKQEAIKAFGDGKEIIITMNQDPDCQYHLTIISAKNEQRCYERLYGKANEKDFRRMHIADYIECLTEDYKATYGKANMDYRLA